jgi:hypothetical protein
MGALTNGQRLTAEECRWVKLLSTLNEAQARWFVADKALDLGRGAVSRMSQVTGMSQMTITNAMKELRGRGVLRPAALGRIRRAGAGRKRIEESYDPQLFRPDWFCLDSVTSQDGERACRVHKSDHAARTYS